MNIHKTMREQTDLAKIYAEDGAFHSAASILLKLSLDVKKHAEWCDKPLPKRG